MIYRVIRNCTFKNRPWIKGQIVDLGDLVPPHHFVAVDEKPTIDVDLRPRVDIMAAVPTSIASNFHEMAASAPNVNVGFATTLEKEERIVNPRQFKSYKNKK